MSWCRPLFCLKQLLLTYYDDSIIFLTYLYNLSVPWAHHLQIPAKVTLTLWPWSAKSMAPAHQMLGFLSPPTSCICGKGPDRWEGGISCIVQAAASSSVVHPFLAPWCSGHIACHNLPTIYLDTPSWSPRHKQLYLWHSITSLTIPWPYTFPLGKMHAPLESQAWLLKVESNMVRGKTCFGPQVLFFVFCFFFPFFPSLKRLFLLI